MKKFKPLMSPAKLEWRKKKAAVVMKKLRKLFPKAQIVLKYGNNWVLLVAVMLSAQCTDKQVNKVTEKLFKKYRKLDDYVKADIKVFEQDIKSTGFYHNKAKNVLAAAKVIQEKYGGKIPKTMDEMLEIPGVARKTANVVLGNAYGIVEGIAVDTHVKRLAKMFDLTDHSDPNKVEKDLMAIIPKKDWFQTTYLLIDYGRAYCVARPHKHESCPIQ
jgi:endonuclease-3